MLAWSVAELSRPSLGSLQTVQRAELWGAIVALQSYWPCHLGTDNLNVARSIGQAAGSWLYGQTSAFGQRWRFGCSFTYST